MGQILLALLQTWWILLIVILIALLVYALLVPVSISRLTSHPHPASSYAQALERIEQLRAQAPAGVNPACSTQFLTHGKKVERAIVLVHGLSNCPKQFELLGRQFFERGYNVLIPRIPQHGLADRLTGALSQLTAEQLAAYSDDAVDIACVLGEKVTMMGLSMGGVITGWAAHNRPELEQAILLCPGFGAHIIPSFLTVLFVNLAPYIPEFYLWWDAKLKADTGPSYAYPRYSMHSYREVARLGMAVIQRARHTAPITKNVLVVSLENDLAVNRTMIEKVVHLWQARGARVPTYEFPASLDLDHDLIDPNHAKQHIDVVYPRMIELTERTFEGWNRRRSLQARV